ncbi:hypothetical protein BD560DRAFT_325736 [Blakeslea trispora]|nr:hypothetical protein BD560DRAFT_325736 [Blakeslea trispora]
MLAELKLTDSVLYPSNILKMLSILGLILIFIALIGILGSFYKDRRTIHILYLTMVIAAFIYQISIGAIVYDQTAHTANWLSSTWSSSTREYRLYAQDKFNCCGFATHLDYVVPSSTCTADHVANTLQACQQPLTDFVKKKLTHIYIALFTSLAIELLALCNVITLLCTQAFVPTKRKWVSPECNYSDDTLVSQYQHHSAKSVVY